MALELSRFIEACYSVSRVETINRRPVLRAQTPDGYSSKTVYLDEKPEDKDTLDYIAEQLLPWFQNVYPLYDEDTEGNIIRKGAGAATGPVDVKITVDDLLKKAQELGIG